MKRTEKFKFKLDIISTENININSGEWQRSAGSCSIVINIYTPQAYILHICTLTHSVFAGPADVPTFNSQPQFLTRVRVVIICAVLQHPERVIPNVSDSPAKNFRIPGSSGSPKDARSESEAAATATFCLLPLCNARGEMQCNLVRFSNRQKFTHSQCAIKSVR